ncbi:uncharacterized protein LOC143902266 isoform X1 [Temnothorax americanus]|uniref:uncharacterized protein LOC143902266 isoform X1 n=1 Tax=Temnothorax americanus TaxID=1964332 RepID=UPI0040679AC3
MLEGFGEQTIGTYKCVWQGYPILQIGTTDMYRSYHPFGVAVTTFERASDYAFIFAAVKKGLKNLYNLDYNPEILISDAKSIHNGFEQVFGEQDFIIMCWVHMRRAVVDNLTKYDIRTTKDQKQLLHDLDQLQLSQSTEIFNKAAELFVAKWEKVSTAFTNYFESEWLHSHRYWYEGVRQLTPSTNNALESANKRIKDEHTFRERYELSRFRTVMFDIVQTWSLAYFNGKVEVHNSPAITLEQWTTAYAWAKTDFHMAVSENEGRTLYTIPADPKVNIVTPARPCRDVRSRGLKLASLRRSFKPKRVP